VRPTIASTARLCTSGPLALRTSTYARTHTHSTKHIANYLPTLSYAVIFVELTKLAACSLMQLRETAAEARRTGAPLSAAVSQEFHMIAARSRPMALPAGLFVCQQVREAAGPPGWLPWYLASSQPRRGAPSPTLHVSALTRAHSPNTLCAPLGTFHMPNPVTHPHPDTDTHTTSHPPTHPPPPTNTVTH
jgi:hypothetical protein